MLKQGGVLGLGMKAGTGEIFKDGRLMVLWGEDEITKLVREAGLEVLDVGQGQSLDGRDLVWINIVARRNDSRVGPAV